MTLCAILASMIAMGYEHRTRSTAIPVVTASFAGDGHEMMLCLPAGHWRTIRLILWRGPGPDFSERDRTLLALLRPHLHQAYLDDLCQGLGCGHGTRVSMIIV